MDLQFIGGCYDGYTQHVDIDPDALLYQVRLPVCRTVIEVLTGEPPSTYKPVQCVAVYELMSGLTWQAYIFRCFERANDRDWSRWCMDVIQRAKFAAQRGEGT